MAQITQMGADPLQWFKRKSEPQISRITQIARRPTPAWARLRRLPARPEVTPVCRCRAPQEAQQRRPGMEPMLDLRHALSPLSPSIPG